MNYYCNPMNLPYKYQIFEREGRYFANREAADPSLILFKGTYYLFPSMAGGFYMSDDLQDWVYHEMDHTMPLLDYAPDVRAIGDYLYFSASKRNENCDFYRTKDPVNEPFERIEGSFPFWDPNLFADDDGRIYFYWGCSNMTPIYGCELDPQTMQPVSERKELIFGNDERNGFERIGEDHYNVKTPEMIESGMQGMVIHMFPEYTDYHDLPQDKQDFLRAFISSTAPFIEGAWMTKHDGRYYLQYAAPATETNVYNDGVYVSDDPLGPFTPAKNNPYSYHPGGFLTGAGHGSTLEDKNGRFWHVSSMHISVNHDMERRLGIWRAGFDNDGELYCDQYLGDFPRKMDAAPWTAPEWMLLSYGKKAVVSSGAGAENLTDENIKTVWQAAKEDTTPNACIDLGSVCRVHAVQLNFMDHQLEIPKPENASFLEDRAIDFSAHVTRWILETSTDGDSWSMLCDRSAADTDLPHDLIVAEDGISARFVRIRVMEVPFHAPVCMAGIRIFGHGSGNAPGKPLNVTAQRTTPLDMHVSWESDAAADTESSSADGYVVSWGYEADKLYHSYTVYRRTEQKIGALMRGEPVFYRVDAFNENGISKGDTQQLF